MPGLEAHAELHPGFLARDVDEHLQRLRENVTPVRRDFDRELVIEIGVPEIPRDMAIA